MKTKDEGVIKYNQSGFVPTDPLPKHEYSTLEKWRKLLNQMELIGAYPDGMGFGNISQKKDYSKLHKTSRPQFIITGTQTGYLKDLTGEHYTRVIDFDIENFSIKVQGPISASSEALTHAAIYLKNPYINAVAHIHSIKMWEAMIKDKCLSTSRWILYGTHQMALAVQSLVKEHTQGIFVMKGHQEGIIAYGPNMVTTINIIKKMYKKYIDPKYDLT